MSKKVIAAMLIAAAGCGGSVEQVERRRELPPADPRAVRLFVAGARLLERGRDEAARARFRRALAIDSTVWEAHYNLGVIERRRGRLRDAVPHFQAALEVQPAARSPKLALAEANYALGEREAAGELLEELVAKDPSAIDARVALATILREQGDYDDALEQAREVLVRDSSSVGALAEVGRVYLAREMLDVAALVFKKALDLTEDGAKRTRARLHNDLGLVELARGDTQAAFQEFGRAIEIDPGYAPAHLNQGAVLLRAGDYEGAAREYKAVLEGNPHHADARVALGAALRGQGQHALARRQYEHVLEAHPHHPGALFNLAVLRAEFLDERPRARELFERFLEVAPSDHPRREVARRYLRELPAPPPGPGHTREGTG